MDVKNHHMQKTEREMSDPERIIDVIHNGKFVTLALTGENEPYIVTLSYGFDSERMCLYFHSAFKGLKLDILRSNPRVCATIIEDLGYRHGECSHSYRSVIIFGTIAELTDMKEKEHGMITMFRHLEASPMAMRERFLKDDAVLSKVNVLRLDIEDITGKESPPR